MISLDLGVTHLGIALSLSLSPFSFLPPFSFFFFILFTYFIPFWEWARTVSMERQKAVMVWKLAFFFPFRLNSPGLFNILDKVPYLFFFLTRCLTKHVARRSRFHNVCLLGGLYPPWFSEAFSAGSKADLEAFQAETCQGNFLASS